MARPLRALGCAFLASTLAVVGACGDDGAADDDGRPEREEETTPVLSAAGALPELTPLRVRTVADRPSIVDGSGREVLLRGATHTGLAALPQLDPERPPTRPPTEDDWDDMAAHGFGVVRLAVSWSALEPLPGVLDEAYIERIRTAVESAASRRIYTVVALHQDAWGPAVATPPETSCPADTQPALPGTGAPGWATPGDVPTTCHPVGDPRANPAVRSAFDALYTDRDGTRTALATTWQRLVAALGDTAAIAGYDLFDEPLQVFDPALSELALTDLYRTLIGAVRAGEEAAGAHRRLVLVQPSPSFPAAGSLPAHPLALDGDIVLAPHVGERTGGIGGPAPQVVDALAEAATERGWPLWLGEMGVGSIEADARALGAAVAAAQDAALAGGAWWEWRRWCGAPEAAGPGGGTGEIQVQLNDVGCPDDIDLGPNDELLRLAGRAHPRLTPGRLVAVEADVDHGTLRVRGRIDDDLESTGGLVLWVPGERPAVSGEGIGEVEVVEVVGGWYVTVEVTGSPYEVRAVP